MSEIPKIARARLERQSAGAGSHPDADQMTAFLERSLGAREREQVLEHLARCAECREVVAVALPPEETVRVAQPAREFRWFEWSARGGRWAAVAATFVIAVSLVFQTYRQQAPLPSFAKKAQDRQAAAPATVPAESAKPAEAAPADEAQPRANAAAAKAKPPSSSAVAVLRDQEKETVSGPSKLDAVTRAQTGQKKGELAAGVGVGSGAGGGIGGGRMDDAKKLGKEGKAEVGGTYAAKAAAPSAPAVAAGSMRGPAMQQQQAGALAQQAPPAPPAAREELHRQAAAEPSRATADQAETAKVTAQNGVRSAETAEKDADKRARNDSIGAAPADGFAESRRIMSPASATTRWIIHESRVQRSTDSGRTWKDATPDPQMKFRALARVGSDVWAGGDGGALYHSSDSGAHWTRVPLPEELASATLVRVEFTDARHGTLTTSAGETWATSDAGATWRKM